MDQQSQIAQLQSRVDELTAYIDRLKGSGNFPQEITEAFINNGFLRVENRLVHYGGFAVRQFDTITTRSGFKKYVISTENFAYFIPISINTGSDTVTSRDGTTFSDGLTVIPYSSGDVPAELQYGQPLYTVNSSGTSVQLSDTIGGAPISLTTPGYGDIYLNIID